MSGPDAPAPAEPAHELEPDPPRPLADRLRPRDADEVVGQGHLLDAQGPLRRMLATGRVQSLVFWGPPGTGKTTLARLLAGVGGLHFEQISAIFSGVADLKKVFAAARQRRENGQGTLLFVDEIHRFNRSQQDSFLPVVEDGSIVLVGATTENPSFELNAALMSRLKVLVLERLDRDALATLLARAETHLGRTLPLSEDARELLLELADGDGRYLINLIETVTELADPEPPMQRDALLRLVQRRALSHDKDRDAHYNLVSALHKSLRASDVDAALYWLARSLGGGEDPRYITRRLIRFASEDVGLADPQALTQALAAREAYDQLGSPEGELAIAQAVVYLGTAPKSNALYRAMGRAGTAARKHGALPPPKHLVNAPTRLMKEQGYGRDYVYDHDTPAGFSGQSGFPETLPRSRFYQPVERGFERDVKRRLEYWDRLRRRAQDQGGSPPDAEA